MRYRFRPTNLLSNRLEWTLALVSESQRSVDCKYRNQKRLRFVGITDAFEGVQSDNPHRCYCPVCDSRDFC